MIEGIGVVFALCIWLSTAVGCAIALRCDPVPPKMPVALAIVLALLWPYYLPGIFAHRIIATYLRDVHAAKVVHRLSQPGDPNG